MLVKFFLNSACVNFASGSCAVSLAQNQPPEGVKLTSTDQLLLVNLQTGFNRIKVNQTLAVPQWSILGFSQVQNNYGGPRVDTSGTAPYPEYMMNVVNQSQLTYTLTRFSQQNYRFYVQASVTELVLSKFLSIFKILSSKK